MTVSAIYDGTVRHRRFTVRNREFTYPLGLLYLDLDELPTLLGGRLLRRGPGLIRFRRADFHRPEIADLATAIRDTVKAETGFAPEGPIRLLAQLRSTGGADEKRDVATGVRQEPTEKAAGRAGADDEDSHGASLRRKRATQLHRPSLFYRWSSYICQTRPLANVTETAEQCAVLPPNVTSL